MVALWLTLSLVEGGLTVGGTQPGELSRETLTARPDLQRVTVVSPDLGGPREVQAVRLGALLGPAPSGVEGVDVGCADGFVAVLPASALANDARQPVAYLAIETDADPWPRHHPDGGVGEDLGPFMVVWVTPPGVTVPREQWPYQVVRLAFSAPLTQRYPKLVPSGGGPAARGLQVFAINCLACHPLNGEGPAEVGPDLNQPQSPLEYLGQKRLAAYVRDPQSLHRWANEKMPAFPTDVLTRQQLSDLIAYLKDRSTHR